MIARRFIIAAVGWVALAGPACATLIGHWGCQDNAASTTVVATVASNGTLNGGSNTSAISTTGPGNLYPLALHFDGSDDYISITNLSASISSTATVCLWVKLDVATPAASAQTGLMGITTTLASHYPYTDGSAYLGVLRNNRVNSITLPGGVTRTAWHHVAIVTQTGANGWKLYVNGDLVTQTTGETLGTIAYWVVGYSGFGHYLDGSIADVRVYDDAKTEADIETIMLDATGGGGGGTPVRRQAIIVGSLDRKKWQPVDVRWQDSNLTVAMNP